MSKKEEKDYILTIIDHGSFDSEEHRAYFEENQIYAILDDATLPVRFYDPRDIEFTDQYAYMLDGYFYLYKGNCMRNVDKGPGIFTDPETKKSYIVKVNTDNPSEEAKYRICPDHIASFDNKTILEDLKQNAEEIYDNKERITRLYLPKVSSNDNLLKRAMKTAMINKEIDIDSCRDRFTDKNATFNFKQSLKTDNSSFSFRLFERGADAFNLKYTLIIEEANPDNSIGKKLDAPIVVSSTDTYDI